MHSCLLLILITWKLENAVLHLEQEGLSCFGRRGGRLEVGPSLIAISEGFESLYAPTWPSPQKGNTLSNVRPLRSDRLSLVSFELMMDEIIRKPYGERRA